MGLSRAASRSCFDRRVRVLVHDGSRGFQVRFATHCDDELRDDSALCDDDDDDDDDDDEEALPLPRFRFLLM